MYNQPIVSETLTPTQVAALLGVGASSVRRWCDSKKLKVQKTSGGHRRIAKQELLKFVESQGLEFVTGGPTQISGKGGRCLSVDELINRFYSLVTRGAQSDVDQFCESLIHKRGKPSFLCDQIIAPVMSRIGDEWSDGQLPIFKEHIATQVVWKSLQHACSASPRLSSQAPVAITAALTDDPYTIAPMMSTLVLKHAGFQAIALGVNTPAGELVQAAIEMNAELIILSIGRKPQFPSTLIDLCERAEKLDISIALGGRMLDAQIRKRIAPDFMGDTMAHLEKFATSRLKRFTEKNKDGAS